MATRAAASEGVRRLPTMHQFTVTVTIRVVCLCNYCNRHKGETEPRKLMSTTSLMKLIFYSHCFKHTLHVSGYTRRGLIT